MELEPGSCVFPGGLVAPILSIKYLSYLATVELGVLLYARTTVGVFKVPWLKRKSELPRVFVPYTQAEIKSFESIPILQS